MFTQFLNYFLSREANIDNFNIITNHTVEDSSYNSPIFTYVGKHFFILHKFCDLYWEEYIEYILQNSTNSNYLFVAIRENTDRINATKSQTWMVISFEEEVTLSL